jgi:hypothetical protein
MRSLRKRVATSTCSQHSLAQRRRLTASLTPRRQGVNVIWTRLCAACAPGPRDATDEYLFL